MALEGRRGDLLGEAQLMKDLLAWIGSMAGPTGADRAVCDECVDIPCLGDQESSDAQGWRITIGQIDRCTVPRALPCPKRRQVLFAQFLWSITICQTTGTSSAHMASRKS